MNAKIDHVVQIFRKGPTSEILKEWRVLREISKDEKLIYVRVDIPMMSKRDAIVHWKKEDQLDGSASLTLQSVDSDEVPIQEGVIRIELFKS